MAAPLQFAPFTSEIELPFYSALFASKLDYDKLDDSARGVLGLYEPRLEEPDSSCKMQILGNALTSQEYACFPRLRRTPCDGLGLTKGQGTSGDGSR